MAKKTKEKSYWPHMIVGFLLVGITLGYWTVKTTISMPVHESNEYMLKYQKADYNINKIMDKEALFNKDYSIEIVNAPMETLELENVKRAKAEKSIILVNGQNSFTYRIIQKDNTFVPDANVTFLLTRPHTTKEDILVENVAAKNGAYHIDDINITKPGRYTLQLRAKVGDATGYSNIPAYLKP